MEQVLDALEKRYFKCEKCNYTVQVYGESYFDSGCYNYIGTFLCKECKILFESYLTKVKEWDTPGDFIYDLDEETTCLRCGKMNFVVWNKDTGRCPKCDSSMKHEVKGKIKVH